MKPETEKRASGIALVGELPWGSHFCQFYRTKKDLLDVLIPYFRAGLENEEALARGFAGMRVSGNPYWIDNKKDWDDFACYEAEINNVIGGNKLLVLCTYSLKKCGVVEIMDVVKNHKFALAMNHGDWQVVNMSAFS